MMKYPTIEISLSGLLLLSLRYVWPTLRQIFALIVVFVVLKSLYTQLPSSPVFLEMALGFLLAAIAIFLLSIAFCQMDGLWRGSPLSLWRAGVQVFKNIPWVYGVFLLLAAAFTLIFLLSKWLVFSWAALTGAVAGATMLILVGVPLIFMLLYSYLAIPLLALGRHSLWQALYDGASCTYQNFLSVFLLYVEMVVLLVVSSTHTRHSQWLLSHHLMMVSDFIIFSVILPLVINQTLLLLHKAKLIQN